MLRLFLILVLLSLTGVVSAEPTTAPATQPNRLIFVTYNILYDDSQAKLRAPALMKILADSDADFIALQEVMPWHLKLLRDEAWAKKYHQTPAGLKQPPGGLVILSKAKPVTTVYRELTSPSKRGVRIAHYRIDGRSLAVATVHLESPFDAGETRANQLREVFSLLKTADDAVLLGDLNFAEDWKPETANLPKTFVDVWKAVKGEDPPEAGYTWNIEVSPLARANSSPKDNSGRIDRILIRSDVWKPVEAKILGDKPVDEWNAGVFPSDHFGLMGVVAR